MFLEPKRVYRLLRQDVEDSGEPLPLDVCFTLREGSDITIVTWGAMVYEVTQVAEELQAEGVSAEVIDVATIKPLDIETILQSVEKTGRCVIVHEAARTCGIGAEIGGAFGRARTDVFISTGAKSDGIRHHLCPCINSNKNTCRARHVSIVQ